MHGNGVLAGIPDCVLEDEFAAIDLLAHGFGEPLRDIARRNRTVQAALFARASRERQTLAADLIGEILELFLLAGDLHVADARVFGDDFELTRGCNDRESFWDKVIARESVGHGLNGAG